MIFNAIGETRTSLTWKGSQVQSLSRPPDTQLILLRFPQHMIEFHRTFVFNHRNPVRSRTQSAEPIGVRRIMTESNRADDAGAALAALKEIMAGPAEGPRMQALLDRHGAAIIAALEAASRRATAAESDWVLVPREPTKEMSYAAGKEFQSDRWTWFTIYRAVIGAAPKPGDPPAGDMGGSPAAQSQDD
jgi:hypothetical protein